MKKVLTILLASLFLFSFGCAGDNTQGQGDKDLIPEVYYSVIFDSDSDEVVAPQSIKQGDKVNEPTLKAQMKTTIIGNVQTEYKFKGWYSGEQLYDFNSPVNSDLTIVAKWEKQGEELVHKK